MSRRTTLRVAVRAFGLALALALAAASGAGADETRLRTELQAFDYMSLWHDNQRPVATTKWLQPVRWRIVGLDPGGWRGTVVETLARFATLSGVDVAEVADGQQENFTISVEEISLLIVDGRGAGCVTYTWRDAATGGIARAQLRINLRQGPALKACIVHELMHAFGFPGHPHDLDSVLSYVMRRDHLTALDESAIRTLYDRRIRPGLYHLPALILARQALAERFGMPADEASLRGVAAGYLDEATVWLKRMGERGDLFAQAQLGNAYWFGHHVAVDAAEARRWWTLAADGGEPNAAFWLGRAAATGEKDTPRSDAEAVRWYRMAAAKGHAQATSNLGQLIEAGRGAAADPVEAWAHYILAAESGNGDAKANAARLAAARPADLARAQARAAAIKAARQ